MFDLYKAILSFLYKSSKDLLLKLVNEFNKLKFSFTRFTDRSKLPMINDNSLHDSSKITRKHNMPSKLIANKMKISDMLNPETTSSTQNSEERRSQSSVAGATQNSAPDTASDSTTDLGPLHTLGTKLKTGCINIYQQRVDHAGPGETPSNIVRLGELNLTADEYLKL